MLLALIDAGSASAHRSYKPDTETIHHMMDILEAIFHSLLVEPDKRKELERKAAELRRTTPKSLSEHRSPKSLNRTKVQGPLGAVSRYSIPCFLR